MQVDNKLIPSRYGLNSNAPVEPVTDMINYLSEKDSINNIDSTTQHTTNYSTRIEWEREDLSEIRMDQLESTGRIVKYKLFFSFFAFCLTFFIN